MSKLTVDIGFQQHAPVDLILDKNGLSCSEEGKKSSAMVQLLKNVIDTASWSHSWHINFSLAQYSHRSERKRVRELLDSRIAALEEQLSQAKTARAMFRRWK